MYIYCGEQELIEQGVVNTDKVFSAYRREREIGRKGECKATKENKGQGEREKESERERRREIETQ